MGIINHRRHAIILLLSVSESSIKSVSGHRTIINEAIRPAMRRMDDVEDIDRSPKAPKRRDIIINRLAGPLASASLQRTMNLPLQILCAEHPDRMNIVRWGRSCRE